MGQSSIIIHKGGREAKYEICVEDYVISFLKGETGTLELSEFYFYGYREKGGRRYVIYGAGRDKGLAVFDQYSLLEEIGCRLTQAGPVFLVREGQETYEVKGYDVFYQDNGEMQSYLISLRNEEKIGADALRQGKENAGGAGKRNYMDQSANSDGALANRLASANKAAHEGASAISLQLGIILVALIAIMITSTNSYDKMQQLNRSASEVFFAIENQEAGELVRADGGKDEIVVERDMTQEDDMQEELLMENAESDAGQAEAILKLVTLENEEQAGNGDETDVQEMTDDVPDNDGQEAEAAGSEKNETSEETELREQEEADEDAQQESTAEDAASGESAGESSDDEEVEALSRNVARYYKVEKGDTLYMISKKVYGDISHVKKICEVNNITDPDNIRYGQKIILP